MPQLIAPSESPRPALIFDVDDSLRVLADRKPDGYIVQPGWPLFAYNPALSGLINVLLQENDGYYISDWRESCHEHIGKTLELPELDWINDDPFRPQAHDVSSRALAITALFGDRPVVWVDDEITESDIRWSQQRDAPTFLEKPDPERGLEPIAIELIAAWLELVKNPQP